MLLRIPSRFTRAVQASTSRAATPPALNAPPCRTALVALVRVLHAVEAVVDVGDAEAHEARRVVKVPEAGWVRFRVGGGQRGRLQGVVRGHD
eukprot:4269851-Prymnesium_polylepis.1